MSIGAVQPNLTIIVPVDPNAEAKASLTFGQSVDFVLHAATHAFARQGYENRSAIPGWKARTLLSVRNYDFNWQIVYYKKTPLHFPQGTELQLTAPWDNSSTTSGIPTRLRQSRWGDQGWQQMMTCPMGVIVDRMVDPKSLAVRGAFPGASGVQ